MQITKNNQIFVDIAYALRSMYLLFFAQYFEKSVMTKTVQDGTRKSVLNYAMITNVKCAHALLYINVQVLFGRDFSNRLV